MIVHGSCAASLITHVIVDPADPAFGAPTKPIGPQALLLVTAVDRVMLDYGTPRQSSLGAVTADEMARHLDEGQFPRGSMGPEIEAALQFLGDGGDLAVVTSPGLLARTLEGADPAGGTRISARPIRAGSW